MLKPDWSMEYISAFMKKPQNLQIVYGVFLVGVGYYIFQAYRPVEVAAMMLFTIAFVGFHLSSYPKLFKRMAMDFAKKPVVACTAWIWVAFAVWVLWTMYA